MKIWTGSVDAIVNLAAIMRYDEEPEDTYGDDDTNGSDEDVHSDDWGDTESEEEQGFDDDERD